MSLHQRGVYFIWLPVNVSSQNQLLSHHSILTSFTLLSFSLPVFFLMTASFHGPCQCSGLLKTIQETEGKQAALSTYLNGWVPHPLSSAVSWKMTPTWRKRGWGLSLPRCGLDNSGQSQEGSEGVHLIGSVKSWLCGWCCMTYEGVGRPVE